MSLCRFIRWKGRYGRTWTRHEELEAVHLANELPYQCNRTCEPWGPDEAPASLDQCVPERACFEPSADGPRS